MKGEKIMYEIIMINEFGEKFTKNFTIEYQYTLYLNKATHSKTLTILSYHTL